MITRRLIAGLVQQESLLGEGEEGKHGE